MKRIVFLCLFCFGFSPAALAVPGMGGDRFAAADADKDGFLSREEFFAAFPTLKKEAFAIIDTDKDGRVSRGEWQTFSGGHGQGMGGRNADGQTASPPDGAANGSLPLLPIPERGGAAEPAPQESPSLPLLAPPSR